MNQSEKMVRFYLTATLSALMLFSCLGPPWVGSTRPWAGSSKFTEALRCGMTAAEITDHALRFPGLRLHRPTEREDLLVGQKGDTIISLELEGPGLRTYQVSWTSGLTKQTSALMTNLCTGQQLVRLHIVSDPRNAGAAILLDGKRVGTLSRQGTVAIDVPIGAHLLLVKMGTSSWSAKLRYDSSSPGYDRVPVPGGAFEPTSNADIPDRDCALNDGPNRRDQAISRRPKLKSQSTAWSQEA